MTGSKPTIYTLNDFYIIRDIVYLGDISGRPIHYNTKTRALYFFEVDSARGRTHRTDIILDVGFQESIDWILAQSNGTLHAMITRPVSASHLNEQNPNLVTPFYNTTSLITHNGGKSYFLPYTLSDTEIDTMHFDDQFRLIEGEYQAPVSVCDIVMLQASDRHDVMRNGKRFGFITRTDHKLHPYGFTCNTHPNGHPSFDTLDSAKKYAIEFVTDYDLARKRNEEVFIGVDSYFSYLFVPGESRLIKRDNTEFYKNYEYMVEENVTIERAQDVFAKIKCKHLDISCFSGLGVPGNYTVDIARVDDGLIVYLPDTYTLALCPTDNSPYKTISKVIPFDKAIELVVSRYTTELLNFTTKKDVK